MVRQQLDVKRVLANLVPKNASKQNAAMLAVHYIEKVLSESYTEVRYAQRKYTTYEERKSLLIATLYKLILKQKALPTAEEFTEAYLNENSHLPDVQIERYFANIGYLSLVTDLHFYFVLKQSELFDEVVIDYDFDLSAQTDIILHKGSKTLGLQLFAGSPKSEQGKAIQLSQISDTLSYPLRLYSRRMNEALHKELITNSGSKIVLYSEKDAQYIERLLENQEKEPIDNFNGDTFDTPSQHFFTPTPPKEKQLTPVKDEEFEKLLDQAEHSILIFGKQYSKQQASMEALALERGISVYFYNTALEKLPAQLQNVDHLIDGKHGQHFLAPAVYKALQRHFTEVDCNIFQYEVEHFDTTSDLIVTAGAGSGKTHTLVSRTLFLLNTEAVKSIKEIAMITFTNEAADNMRIKLADRFIELFRKTGDEKYRTYLEELQEMQISTIPSFAKSILQSFGQFIGLGAKVNISNLTMDRRELIDTDLDGVLSGTSNLKLFGDLPYHEIVKFIEQIWEKVEQKGVSLKEFAISSKYGEMFKQVLELLVKVEAKFKDKKIEKNTVTLADLTRLLKELVDEGIPLERLEQQYSYLFIDEFQDTDNSQINFIVEIATKANIPLLVVGDSKQSVYRFRGANESAFKYLQDSLQERGRTVHEVSLRYNYRTTAILLNQMEQKFTAWRQGDWLPKDEKPMIAKKMTANYSKNDSFGLFSESLTPEEIVSKYKDIQTKKKHDGSPVSMAILVRKNYEAKNIAKVLQAINQQHSKLVYDVQLEGTLFQSKAAKDLLILLDSWIGIEDPVALYALSETVFCRDYMKEKNVILQNYMYTLTEAVDVNIPQAWYDALEHLKYNPAMLVLNEFLAQVPYIENMLAQNMEDFECTKYQLNLYKILMLMYAALDEQTDLLSMYHWLSIQVATNQSEDEVPLDDADFDVPIVKVMTVHKSKGLEFHTVLIPFTRSYFIRQEPAVEHQQVNYDSKPFVGEHAKKKYLNIIVHVNQQHKEIGWFYAIKDTDSKNRLKYKFDSITPNYFDLKKEEDTKSAQEEARVLYVAMTRAEERCFLYEKNYFGNGNDPKNWSDLLNMRGEQ